MRSFLRGGARPAFIPRQINKNRHKPNHTGEPLGPKQKRDADRVNTARNAPPVPAPATAAPAPTAAPVAPAAHPEHAE